MKRLLINLPVLLSLAALVSPLACRAAFYSTEATASIARLMTEADEYLSTRQLDEALNDAGQAYDLLFDSCDCTANEKAVLFDQMAEWFYNVAVQQTDTLYSFVYAYAISCEVFAIENMYYRDNSLYTESIANALQRMAYVYRVMGSYVFANMYMRWSAEILENLYGSTDQRYLSALREKQIMSELNDSLISYNYSEWQAIPQPELTKEDVTIMPSRTVMFAAKYCMSKAPDNDLHVKSCSDSPWGYICTEAHGYQLSGNRYQAIRLLHNLSDYITRTNRMEGDLLECYRLITLYADWGMGDEYEFYFGTNYIDLAREGDSIANVPNMIEICERISETSLELGNYRVARIILDIMMDLSDQADLPTSSKHRYFYENTLKRTMSAMFEQEGLLATMDILEQSFAEHPGMRPVERVYINALFEQAKNMADQGDQQQADMLYERALRFTQTNQVGDCSPYILRKANKALEEYADNSDFEQLATSLYACASIVVQGTPYSKNDDLGRRLMNLAVDLYHKDEFVNGYYTEQMAGVLGDMNAICTREYDDTLWYAARDRMYMFESTVNQGSFGDAYITTSQASIGSYHMNNIVMENLDDSTTTQHDSDIRNDSMHVSMRLNHSSARVTSHYVTELLKTANKYIKQGDGNLAERYTRLAMRILTENFPYYHSDNALGYYNLARIDELRGDWLSMKENAETAGAIYSEIDDLSQLYSIATFLSKYYRHFSDHEEALRWAEIARELLSVAGTEDVTDKLMEVYYQYAQCLMDRGKLDDGIDILHELRQEVVDTYGDLHPDNAKILSCLMGAYMAEGNESDATKCCVIAHELYSSLEESLLSHYSSATLYGTEFIHFYSRATDLFIQKNELDNAYFCGSQAVKYAEKIYGERHPFIIDPVAANARVYWQRNDTTEAVRLANYAHSVATEVFGAKHSRSAQTALALADMLIQSQQVENGTLYADSAVNNIIGNLQHDFTFLTAQQRAEHWQQEQLAFNPIKSAALAVQSDRLNATVYNILLLSKGLLLSSETELARLIAESGDSTLLKRYERLRELTLKHDQLRQLGMQMSDEQIMEKNNLENIILKEVQRYGDFTSRMSCRWTDVRQAIQDNDVVIEFCQTTMNEDTVYAAAILRKNYSAPTYIPLFTKQELMHFHLPNKPIQWAYDQPEFAHLVWDRIISAANIRPSDRIWFSPDGKLYQIAIEALMNDEQQTMADRYQMVRLSSTRELVYRPNHAEYTLAALYGGIQYDASGADMQAQSQQYATAHLSAERDVDTDTDRGGVNELPGTLTEVEHIAQTLQSEQWQVQLFTALAANEESFKSLNGQRSSIIHIATHGFYWADAAVIDPLNRGGLLMAGANIALQGHSADLPEGVQDGILTAKEIAQMDLRQTDIVVLSACKTGVGEISGDGVFGLQRGFKKAGVQTLIMSLWKVSDTATQLLMTEFYHNWITLKQPKRIAFRNAQAAVRAQYEEPAYWAGFIMLD